MLFLQVTLSQNPGVISERSTKGCTAMTPPVGGVVLAIRQEKE